MRPPAGLHATNAGGMRRTHLRGHANILKRLCIHVGEFNVGLFMRTLCGVGTPRSLQGHLTAVSVLAVAVWARVLGLWPNLGAPAADDSSPFTPHHRFEFLSVNASQKRPFSHGLLGDDFAAGMGAVRLGVLPQSDQPVVEVRTLVAIASSPVSSAARFPKIGF